MKANNNDAAPLNLVFIQTNEYLRAADAKQLQITAAFLAIVSAVVTATADKGGQLLRPSGLGVVIYLLLLAAGFTAFVTLRWYRAWKVHYIGVLQQIVKAWDIDIESLPFIMRETEPINDKERRWWSIDDTFVYFIVFLNLALMAIAASTLLGWLSIEVPLTHQWALALAMVRPVGDYAQFTSMGAIAILSAVAIATGLYLFGLWHMDGWLYRKTCYLRERPAALVKQLEEMPLVA